VERNPTVRAAIADVNHHLGESWDVVLYTSRQLILHARPVANLETGRIVSEAIVQVVPQLMHHGEPVTIDGKSYRLKDQLPDGS
jgi:hypothetical protein